MGTTIEESGRDRVLEAVVKLIQLTQKGELEWRSDKPDESMMLGERDTVGPVYTTDYKGRTLQVYRRAWVDPLAGGALAKRNTWGQFGALTPPELNEQTVLRLATPEGGFWTFPQNSALNDLMNAVAFKVTDANGFLDEILNE